MINGFSPRRTAADSIGGASSGRDPIFYSCIALCHRATMTLVEGEEMVVGTADAIRRLRGLEHLVLHLGGTWSH